MRGGPQAPSVKNLADVSSDVAIIKITKDTLNLDLLPNFPKLRFLSAYDVDVQSFEIICSAINLTHLSINTAGLKSLDRLAGLINLHGLEVTDNTKIDSLAWLSALESLHVFLLANCPVSVDLFPIKSCKELRCLWLSSSYSKPMRINSLDPLGHLAKLESLFLKNVRVADKKLSALRSLDALVKVELPDFFPKKEFLELAASLPAAKGYWLDMHKQNSEK